MDLSAPWMIWTQNSSSELLLEPTDHDNGSDDGDCDLWSQEASSSSCVYLFVVLSMRSDPGEADVIVGQVHLGSDGSVFLPTFLQGISDFPR